MLRLERKEEAWRQHVGVEGETAFLTRYCFSLIRFWIYALRLCLMCVFDVRVCLRSPVGIWLSVWSDRRSVHGAFSHICSSHISSCFTVRLTFLFTTLVATRRCRCLLRSDYGWVVMPYRLAPCDLGDPGWGDPWFPHGAFVASLAFWYGLVILLFFPLFLLPVETIHAIISCMN